VNVTLELATEKDALAIAAVRVAAARQLTEQFGGGTWSFAAESEAGARADIVNANVFLAREGGEVVATLRLSPKNPWIGDIGFFTPAQKPLYLTSMAVAPSRQRQGIGRRCLEEVRRYASQMGADVVRLDSYDAAAGAGDFYRKCGFREVRRDSYNGTPLIWFEARVI
jgi:GNAT superfamily N-acetyltransferase